MARAVDVDEAAKSRLEELQAEIRLRSGTAGTQQEPLSPLVDDASESWSALIDSLRESTAPLSGGENEAMRRGRIRFGRETDEDDVEESRYG